MRTTLDISDELLRQAEKEAADRGRPLRDVVEDALRVYLNPKAEQKPYKLRWRTEKGEQLVPDHVLTDREKLYDLFDKHP